jgi:tyrosyl-tRNA synthetase
MSIPDELKDQEGPARGSMIARYFRLATPIPVEEADAIERGLENGDLDPYKEKRRLAGEIVTTYWGKEAAERAERDFDLMFKSRGTAGLPEDMPRFVIALGPGQTSIYLPEFLRAHEILGSPIAASGAAARNLIDSGAIRVFDGSVGEFVQLGGYELPVEPDKSYALRAGKKRFFAIDTR